MYMIACIPLPQQHRVYDIEIKISNYKRQQNMNPERVMRRPKLENFKVGIAWNKLRNSLFQSKGCAFSPQWFLLKQSLFMWHSLLQFATFSLRWGEKKSRLWQQPQRPTAAEIAQLADWPAPLSIIAPSAPRPRPQTHSGGAASTDDDIQSTCGSSAALEERRERRHSGWGPEKDGERSATGGELAVE